jgi:pimeloyl-ACP methyl ester carboxylesterase
MIEKPNGIDLYFEVHGHGPPLLLLHGFSGTSQDWLPLLGEWTAGFQLIIPDLRGHGRSGTLASPFRHEDAAQDIVALLDHLKLDQVKGVGVSAGGNVLLHIATKQRARIAAMVLVSATPYFPAQSRAITRNYGESLPPEQMEALRRKHPGGDAQIQAILASTRSFADSYTDLNFTPPLLATIEARTLIVQGDRDPLYPLELSVEMARAIPRSSLWIVPGGGHGPIGGARWPEFARTAGEFLNQAN